jgi:hypothetical protein
MQHSVDITKPLRPAQGVNGQNIPYDLATRRPLLRLPVGTINWDVETVLATQATQWLIDVRTVIDKILSTRQDARR